MLGLQEIKAVNRKPTIIRDNFNRDSSFVQSAQGFVIHSGIHRSTAFISLKDHADGHFAFSYWARQGQAAVNAFIEATIDGADLDTCEANAFHKSRPRWKTRRVTSGGKLLSAGEIVATRGAGLVESISAYTWRHLHARTGGAK